jgi:hypothetical protein
MGKSYKQNSDNDRWRKKAQQRHGKKNKSHRFDFAKEGGDKPYSPFDDTPEYHDSFAQ